MPGPGSSITLEMALRQAIENLKRTKSKEDAETVKRMAMDYDRQSGDLVEQAHKAIEEAR